MRLDNQEENFMKKLFAVFILGIALAGVSFAQTTKATEVKIAVVEFSPAPNVAGMTFEAKRHLQASVAYELAETKKFKVIDVKWTRDESSANLATINGGSSTAAAVKLGKQLGVKYVLTGTVVEYTLKGADGFGFVILKTRLIEV